MPPLKMYIQNHMDEEERKAIECWYNERKKNPFIFRNELGNSPLIYTFVAQVITCLYFCS